MSSLPNVGSRVPPHNFEAEMAIIGSILVNNSAWSQASEIVQAQHFADPLHGRLFESLGRLIERGQVVTAFTLKTFAESDEELKKAGGSAYIAKLAGAAVHALDVPSDARLVRDCATRRGLIAATDEALVTAYREDGQATAGEQIEVLERRLYDLADGETGEGFKPFRVGLTAAVKSAESAHSRIGQLTGISTGLHDVDELLGGLHRSDLVVLAGRPGMGKTALGTNMAFAAAKAHRAEGGKTVDGGVVGFFSLEMSSEQLVTRILADRAGVSSERIRRGQLKHAEADRVMAAGAEFEPLPFYIDETPGLSIAQLRTRARRLKRQHGLDLIVVDYIQLLDASKRRQENRVQEISEITRGLKTIAKELDVPVLALSQLSRNVEQRAEKRPQLSDLRDSGSIEQDADVVMFIYREEYYRKQQAQDASDVAGQAELHIAKQRHGPTGMVRLHFDGATTRFSDIDRSDR